MQGGILVGQRLLIHPISCLYYIYRHFHYIYAENSEGQWITRRKKKARWALVALCA